MKALGMRAWLPVRRAANPRRVRIETQGREATRERAVHLLGVKRGSPLRRREVSRSERREGRVKVERAKRRLGRRELTPL